MEFSPSVQWETKIPAGTGRSDLIIYNPRLSSGNFDLAEVKGSWNISKLQEIEAQAQKYIDAIKQNKRWDGHLWDPAEGYSDAYYIGKECENGGVKGWKYDVSIPAAGVVFIQRTRSQCSNGEDLLEIERKALEDFGQVAESIEDGESQIPCDMDSDVNANGVPDCIDFALGTVGVEIPRQFGASVKIARDITVHRVTPLILEQIGRSAKHWLDVQGKDQFIKTLDVLAKNSKLTTVEEIDLVLKKQLTENTRGVLSILGKDMSEEMVGRVSRLAASTTASNFAAEMEKLLGFSTLEEFRGGTEAIRLAEATVKEALPRELSLLSTELPSAARGLTTKVGQKISLEVGEKVSTRVLTIAEKGLVESLAKAAINLLKKRGIALAVSAAAFALGPVGMFIIDVAFTVWLISDVAELLGYNIWGDPHLITLDRRVYDIQSVGEFLMAQTTEPNVTVQGRFEPGGTDISFFKRTVLSFATDRFEVAGSEAFLNGKNSRLMEL